MKLLPGYVAYKPTVSVGDPKNGQGDNVSTRLNTLTYIGGPTALLEICGFRLLTDPTFDPPGGEYPSGAATLRKTLGPALSFDKLGPIDAVLLSHDHHYDNLDWKGREFLPRAGKVITTIEGATRLGGNAIGLANWQSFVLSNSDGDELTITGTPARHGPSHMDRGPVTGFVVRSNRSANTIYISGDTVWYEGVAEVGKRFAISTAVLYLGAARVSEVGPFHLTMTATEAVSASEALGSPRIIPLHFEGWKHFSEQRPEIERELSLHNMDSNVVWPQRGESLSIFSED